MKTKEIYLVTVMPRPEALQAQTDPTGCYSSQDDVDEQQIAIYHRRIGDPTPPRIYRPYKYRQGLRFRRLLKIIGRHA